MRKTLLFVVVLLATVGLWAQNNVITYTASYKLSETTKGSSGSGLHTNAFNVSITSHTFSDGVGTITFDGDVTTIGDYAFFCSYLLTSVTLPSTVTSIGNYAFNYSSSLNSINIPEGVLSIGTYAFSRCEFTSLTIPSTVTSIGSQAFSGVNNIVYNGSATGSPWGAKCVNGYVDGWLVYKTSEKKELLGCSEAATGEIIIPNSVINIGEEAFYFCKSITSITLPSSLISIGNNAFYYCENLKTVYNNSSLNITKGSKNNGYVAYYANNIYDGIIGGDFIIKQDTILTGYIGTDTEVTIPSGIKIIDAAFNGNTKLVAVNIPESVTRLGDRAFYGCTSLTTITIPNSVRSIESYAFYNCSKLTSINIPEGVISIGNGAFLGCTSLPVTDNIRYADTYLVGAVDKTLSSYSIKEGTKWIGTDAFYECMVLKSITIPSSVISIESCAFYHCISLITVTISEGVTSFGDRAFYCCTSLTTITIPKSVKSIENYAFVRCTSLPVTDNIRYADTYLVGAVDKTLSSYSIKEGTKWIGTEAFYECRSLNSITIPSSVISIDYGAFMGCNSLLSLTIPSTVKSINGEALCEVLNVVYSGESAGSPWCARYVNKYVEDDLVYENEKKEYLIDCSDSIKGKIIIPNTVKSIGSKAFYGRSSITSISLPSSLTSIGSQAFYGCNNLKTVYNKSILELSKGSTYYGYVAYYAENVYNGLIEGDFVIKQDTILTGYIGTDSEVTIPSEIKIIDAAFDGNTNLVAVNIPEGVTRLGDRAFYGCSSLTSITIPKSVWMMGYAAFAYCSSLASINIPEGVKEIGNSAFYNCSKLTSITIPSSVKSIDRYMFYNCSSLSSITIPSTVESIGSAAFQECSSLTSITLPSSLTRIESFVLYGCSSLATISIPSKVRYIGDSAFSYCSSLVSITIPKKVTSLKTSAFAGCSSLASINVESGSFYYSSVDGVLFNDTKTTILRYPLGNTSPTYTLPKGVISIGDYAFDHCSYLTSVTIPSSVMRIERYSFYGFSSLTSINITNSLTNINSYAFSSCTLLDTVRVIFSPFVDEAINKTISNYFVNYTVIKTLQGVKVSNISPTCATVKVDLTDVETSQYEKMSLDNGDQEHLLNPGVNTILVTGLHPNKENKLGFYSQLPGSTEWRDGNKVSVTTPALKLTTLNPKIPAKCEAIVCAETNMANDETNAGFEWRKYNAPPEALSKSAKAYVCNGSLQGKIKNMAEEWYKVRAYYETEDSTRYYGEWITFDPTDFSYFDPEVHTYYITDELTTNQATLRGFVMAGTDDITKQGFEYWPETANAPSRTAESDVQVVYATGQVMTATIKELNYSTTYHSRAFATTADTTIYGEEITFTVPEKQRPVYTLTLLAGFGGVVSATPDAPYRENDEITISATPDPGYAFSKWNDGNTQATRTIVLTCDTTFTAEFKVSIPCIVSATATHGTVTGVGTYEYGTQVTLTVVPDAHYHLAQWNDGVTTVSRTFTITQDTTFSAECVIDQYVITATGNNGTVTGGGTYTYGDTVTLTAAPDPGMLFWSWSDGDTINPRVFVATENANYVAIMVAPSYTVTVLSEDVSKGTVTGGGEFAYHTSITITATPNEGYVFQTWNDGNTDNPRTLVVKDNVTLTASFVAATGLDQLPDSPSDRFTKIIKDGQLLILHDGKIYNALGGLVE